jgi:hypothetical protein
MNLHTRTATSSTPTTSTAIALLVGTLLLAACIGPSATSSPASSGSEQTSLLPDGIWEAELSQAELVDAGGPADSAGGVYRWTFDGARARITFNEDEWHCDADASREGDAIRLAYHMATGCGGYDDIGWAIVDGALHLSLEGSSGDEAYSRAILEAKPYEARDGDATLTWPDAWMTCEYPEGGACLNTLEAGTYSTTAFVPGLTYTMPAGWQNTSDLEGEVLFIAPGDSPDDPSAEYIAVFTSVRAQNRNCATEEEAVSDEPGVARTPEAMAAEFQDRPGLVTSTPESVTIGGLSGLVMDISMAPDWTGTCFYSSEPLVQLLGGVAPSEFDHAVVEGIAMRLYLLDGADSTLAIEVGDWSEGANLDTYAELVEQFEFGD